jgi:ribosomal-protein-alanine N-acetyltransferase
MAPCDVPTLDAERVRLRALRHADLPNLFALYSDAQAMRYWSFPPLARIEQAGELFERNERGRSAGDCVPWAIALPSGGDVLVGTCSLFAIDERHRRAQLGYALAPALWGRGYATEAVRLALAHAFGVLRLHRLEADIDPRNASSLRLIERVGFVREGVQRERWFVGGEVQDSALYGLLARDYAAAGSGPR